MPFDPKQLERSFAFDPETVTGLRDSLLQADRAAKLISGGSDFPRFEARYLAFRQQLLAVIETHEQLWADLLESLYSDDAEED